MWDPALVDGAPHFLEVMAFEWFLHRGEVVSTSRAVCSIVPGSWRHVPPGSTLGYHLARELRTLGRM